MHSQHLLSLAVAILSLLSTVQAFPMSPQACSDEKRDRILKGELNPEACCSYGECKGDVVISMFPKPKDL